MGRISCEEFLLSRMARLDGEESSLSPTAEVQHLSACPSCQDVVREMANLGSLFERQSRERYEVDLWPAVRLRLADQPATAERWKPFVLLGIFLVLARLAEYTFSSAVWLIITILPLLACTLVFLFLRENPFRINQELDLGDGSYD